MKYVVLAADKHPDYQFLLPMTAILWSRMGYKPLIISPPTSCAIEARRLSDGKLISNDYEYMGPTVSFRNDRLWTKLLRWSSFQYVNEDDYLLLMDVDLWPIDNFFWRPNRIADKSGICFYGDAFRGERQPTAGFMCKAKVLSEIFRMPARSLNMLDVWEKAKSCFMDDRCHSDDAFMGGFAAEYIHAHPNDFTLVERGSSPPKGRIDRSDWPERFDPKHFDISDKIDAHLPRDASDYRVWMSIYPLFSSIGLGWQSWALAYRHDWERRFQEQL